MQKKVNSVINSYNFLAAEENKYFKQWAYDEPLIISRNTLDNMQFVQSCLYQCILHFVENYTKYSALMPICDATKIILDVFKSKAYRPGTYRTDFLISESGQIKLIEITCRFALNGYIRSGFIYELSKEKVLSNPDYESIQLYDDFLPDLVSDIGDVESVIILGDARYNEAKYFRPVLENSGYIVRTLSMEDILSGQLETDKSSLITQLSHEDLLNLPLDIVESIASSNCLNDLRTVLLIHDKRFFSVLCNEAFREEALGNSLSEQFSAYLVPQFSAHQDNSTWIQAATQKEQWIIKPRVLGMGLGILTGAMCSDEQWTSSLKAAKESDFVLQRYVPQRRFNGTVGEEIRKNDYVVGTLLFFNDKFYGPGLFRASSHPVTNLGDDRKICLVMKKTGKYNADESVI